MVSSWGRGRRRGCRGSPTHELLPAEEGDGVQSRDGLGGPDTLLVVEAVVTVAPPPHGRGVGLRHEGLVHVGGAGPIETVELRVPVTLLPGSRDVVTVGLGGLAGSDEVGVAPGWGHRTLTVGRPGPRPPTGLQAVIGVGAMGRLLVGTPMRVLPGRPAVGRPGGRRGPVQVPARAPPPLCRGSRRGWTGHVDVSHVTVSRVECRASEGPGMAVAEGQPEGQEDVGGLGWAVAGAGVADAVEPEVPPAPGQGRDSRTLRELRGRGRTSTTVGLCRWGNGHPGVRPTPTNPRSSFLSCLKSRVGEF